jgi:hypothetical protein
LQPERQPTTVGPDTCLDSVGVVSLNFLVTIATIIGTSDPYSNLYIFWSEIPFLFASTQVSVSRVVPSGVHTSDVAGGKSITSTSNAESVPSVRHSSTETGRWLFPPVNQCLRYFSIFFSARKTGATQKRYVTQSAYRPLRYVTLYLQSDGALHDAPQRSSLQRRDRIAVKPPSHRREKKF